jgi:hypothetical protein
MGEKRNAYRVGGKARRKENTRKTYICKKKKGKAIPVTGRGGP